MTNRRGVGMWAPDGARRGATTAHPDSDSLVLPDSDPVPKVGSGPGRGTRRDTIS